VHDIQGEITFSEGNEREIAVTDASAATEASKMSDLLSAASLLLTVLGVVYSTWYPEIVNAIGMAIPDHIANRGAVRQMVRAALYGKALPLALAATILTVIFLPDALTIACGALGSFRSLGRSAFREYNAVQAAFCLVVVLTAALAVYLFFLVCRLKGRLRKIATP
jgi:hypothetical protein